MLACESLAEIDLIDYSSSRTRLMRTTESSSDASMTRATIFLSCVTRCSIPARFTAPCTRSGCRGTRSRMNFHLREMFVDFLRTCVHVPYPHPLSMRANTRPRNNNSVPRHGLHGYMAPRLATEIASREVPRVPRAPKWCDRVAKNIIDIIANPAREGSLPD
jgi:hypothetical protein